MAKTDEWLEKAEKELKIAKEKGQVSEKVTELVNELRIHQSELEMQNEELKQSQEEYAELYNKYHDLYNDVPVGYFSLDKEGIIRNVNVKGAELLQTKKENIIGRGFSRFILKDDENKYFQALANSIDTCKNQELELQLIRDEALFDAHMEVLPLFDRDSSRYRIIINDITERKKAEEYLKYQAKILSVINDAIIVADASYRIISWNSRAEMLYGWKEEEVLGKLAKDVLRSEIINIKREKAYQKLESNEPVFTESIQYTKDNRKLWIQGYTVPQKDAQNKITRYIAINQDITERKKAEEALQASEGMFNAFFNASPATMDIFDKEFRYVKFNKAVEKFYNKRADEIQGKSVEEIAPGFLSAVKEPFEAILRTGAAQPPMEIHGESPGTRCH